MSQRRIPLLFPEDALDGTAVTLRGGGEWTSIEAMAPRTARAQGLASFVVETRVHGAAEAAGISFGPYKDCLTNLDPADRPKLLQVDADPGSGAWTFRVDGRRVGRSWWDSHIGSIDDILDGVLTLKAKQAEEVWFDSPTIFPLESSCRVSVVLTCFRFARRLRLALGSWCRQGLPSGALEVIVVNPSSPDGTHDIVRAMAEAYPGVRVSEIGVEPGMARNKGWMLNRAVEASRGEWVWLTDADCVFPADAAARLLDQSPPPASLMYIERRHLTLAMTEALLAGELDATDDFAHAAAHFEGAPDLYPWGFTQILHRSRAGQVRYREDFDHFAQSDGTFVDDCRHAGLQDTRLDGVTCLHLNHAFAWLGTNKDL